MDRPRPLTLLREWLLLFWGVPLALACCGPPRWAFWLLPLAGAGAALWLARRGLPQLRRLFARRPRELRHWRALLLRLALALPLFAATGAAAGGPAPGAGLEPVLLLAYPLLSVLPQELLYRAYFFERYRPLFRRPTAMIAASAGAFGWLHVVYLNAPALLLATLGGLLFAWSYQRSRSLRLVVTEHALYGTALFATAMGGYFEGMAPAV